MALNTWLQNTWLQNTWLQGIWLNNTWTNTPTQQNNQKDWMRNAWTSSFNKKSTPIKYITLEDFYKKAKPLTEKYNKSYTQIMKDVEDSWTMVIGSEVFKQKITKTNVEKTESQPWQWLQNFMDSGVWKFGTELGNIFKNAVASAPTTVTNTAAFLQEINPLRLVDKAVDAILPWDQPDYLKEQADDLRNLWENAKVEIQDFLDADKEWRSATVWAFIPEVVAFFAWWEAVQWAKFVKALNNSIRWTKILSKTPRLAKFLWALSNVTLRWAWWAEAGSIVWEWRTATPWELALWVWAEVGIGAVSTLIGKPLKSLFAKKIPKQAKTAFKRLGIKKYDDLVNAWEKSSLDRTTTTPAELVAKNIEDSFDKAQKELLWEWKKLWDIRKWFTDIVAWNEINWNRFADEFADTIEDRLWARIIDWDKLDIVDAPNRTNQIFKEADERLIKKIYKKVNSLWPNTKLSELDDIAQLFWKMEDKSTKWAFAKLKKDILNRVDELWGKEFKQAKSQYKELMDFLDESTEWKKSIQLQKEFFSSNPTRSKKIFEDIEKITWIDLVPEMEAARFVMDSLQDPQFSKFYPSAPGIKEKIIESLQSNLDKPIKRWRKFVEWYEPDRKIFLEWLKSLKSTLIGQASTLNDNQD